MINFIKSTSQILTSQVIIKILGLLNVMIILKNVSIEDFGIYSYFLVLLNLVGIVIDPFLSSYLVHYRTFNIKKFNLGVNVYSLILLVPFYYILVILNDKISFVLYLLFTLTFLIGTTLKSYTNVLELYKEYGIIDAFKQFGIIISTILYLFVFKQKNIHNLLIFTYVIALLSMVILSIIYLKKSQIEFRFNKEIIQLLKDSRFLIFYTMMSPLILFFDSFFIEKFLSETDLGLYSFSLKIYNISLILVIPIFTVLNIQQIEIAKQNNFTNFFKKNYKKIGLYSIIFLILAQIGNYIITQCIFLKYKETFIDTSILLLGSFITYLCMPFSFLLAYRKYKLLFIIGVLSILVNISINVLFIKSYGTIIPAIGTFLSQVIISLGGALISYKVLKTTND